MSQLHFQGRGFRLTGTPVSITPVSLIIPVRRSRQSGKMGATIPDQGSHLFIVHLFGQIQRVVVARDFISLFARAACLQAA